ncbi:hypothetical protein B4U80_06846 [Leptotrombidium deliense]|uniref:Integrase catalytic domain-containing protein n=1 Tax=Leptotrombidium deliense TaxID=299467 RepID=A0A443SC22_9ACAR|nr:hypothetical protein B4U80_06846 [Leptotrombidium deliense]
MTVSRVLLAEREFIDLLIEANVDPDLIVNDNVRAKYLKLKENKNESIQKETVINEVIEDPVNKPLKRKRVIEDFNDETPDLDKFDEPPPKRSKDEADDIEMPMNKDKETLLKSIYYNPEHPAAFSSSQNLFKYAKLRSSDLTLNEVKNWLSGEITYTLHKPIRRNFKRNKIIVEGIDEQWQADLVEMQKFSKENSGFKYILTVIDVFSKFSWARPIKSKTPINIVNVLKDIFSERIPFSIQTDNGKEFVNSTFKKLTKQYKIIHFTSKNTDVKCAVIERFNRTLKSKMFKYFTSKGTRKFIDVLPKLISAYNETYHRAIKMKPVDVTDLNTKEVFKNIYGVTSRRMLFRKHRLLTEGSTVRRQYKRQQFDKGYYPNWTDAVFMIEKGQNKQQRPTYKIKTGKGERITKTFYPEEIQKVNNEWFRIEKIIKKRKRNGALEYFVKYVNYSNEYNEWIPAKDVIKL